MHWLCCSLNIRCVSIQTARQSVVCVLICMTPSPTVIFTGTFGRRGALWPRQHVNSPSSVFVMSNCSPCALAHSVLCHLHLPSIVGTWSKLLPVFYQPRSSPKDSSLAAEMYSSIHLINTEVSISNWIDDAGEPCGTHAPTRCFLIALSLIIICNVLPVRKLSVDGIRSQSIFLTIIKLTNISLSQLGKAAVLSLRSMPVIRQIFQAAHALSTMMGADLMPDCSFLLPNCWSVCSPLLSASSNSSLATTFWTTFPMQVNSDMEW